MLLAAANFCQVRLFKIKIKQPVFNVGFQFLSPLLQWK